jgi:Glycosyltransferase family 87
MERAVLAERKPDIPLRLSSGRILVYGAVLVFLSNFWLIRVPQMWKGDWAYFVGGGATVGTHDLIGPRHVAWEVHHGVSLALPWNYPPAFAWFFLPFTHVSLGLGFCINALLMFLACVASGLIAARIYGLPVAFSVLAVIAWGPAALSAIYGQNAAVALLLCMLFILGLVRSRPILAGAAVGLLLFKPTDAVPFVLLLLLRREWRALAVVAAACVAWYFASVPAAVGDWMWPYHLSAYLSAYYPHQLYSQFLINISAVAIRSGAPVLLANGMCAALVLLWCVIAVRVSALEAASFAGLVAVATSPHANPHEAALLIPSIFYVMTNVSEPWRTWIVSSTYVLGVSIMLLVWPNGLAPLVFTVAFGLLSYLASRFWLRSSTPPALDPNDGGRDLKRPLTE